MAQILFNRGLVLAKVESTFRTDPVPTELVESFTGINTAVDVDATNDEIDITTHGLADGDGPFQVDVALSSLALNTNYWVNTTGTVGTPVDTISLHTSYSAAKAGTGKVVLTVDTGNIALTMQNSDALLVSDPDVAVEVTALERPNVKTSLSQDPGIVARKIATATFTHEVRGSGVVPTVDPKAPALGVLLRGCGYAETYVPVASTETILSDVPHPVNGPTGDFTFTKTTASSGTLPRIVVFECTSGGGSGSNTFDIYSPPVGAQAGYLLSAHNMTTSTPITLPDSAQITPTVTTAFATGDTFVVQVAPPGVMYEPISESFESLTLYVYFDGRLHRITGARGTGSCQGEAANFATWDFTFTGDFNTVTDTALPAAPVYESTLPPQVELANVTALGGLDFDTPASAATVADEFNLCAQSFSVDLANDVNPRECINGANSLEGAVITGRNPTGAFNPEVELEAFHPFWSNLSSGTNVVWGLRIGSQQGNVQQIFAPHAQYQEIAYGNRTDIRIYDVNLAFRRDQDAGNDELRFYFS